MNVTHEGMQRIKAWRRGVAQCMNNGSHKTETGGETHLIRARATMLGSPPNSKNSEHLLEVHDKMKTRTSMMKETRT